MRVSEPASCTRDAARCSCGRTDTRYDHLQSLVARVVEAGTSQREPTPCPSSSSSTLGMQERDDVAVLPVVELTLETVHLGIEARLTGHAYLKVSHERFPPLRRSASECRARAGSRREAGPSPTSTMSSGCFAVGSPNPSRASAPTSVSASTIARSIDAPARTITSWNRTASRRTPPPDERPVEHRPLDPPSDRAAGTEQRSAELGTRQTPGRRA